MPLCALAVHQLRFYVVFGSHAPAVLLREGHGYLGIAEPAVVLLAALGLGWFAGLLAVARAGPGKLTRRRPEPRGILRIWLVCALLLFAIYCCQELLEGVLSPGHPAGIAGVLGQGGWTAAPLSLLIGAGLATALRVAHRLLEAATRGEPGLWAGAPSETTDHLEPPITDWRLDPQAGVAAGRAPPRVIAPSLI